MECLKLRLQKKLGISRATIARDVSELRRDAGDWIEDLTKDYGHMLYFQIELDRQEDVIYSLIKLRKKETNSSTLIQINDRISRISAKRFELMSMSPLHASLNKFIRKQNSKLIPGSNNIYGLPVLPEDLEREDVKWIFYRKRRNNCAFDKGFTYV